MRERGRLVDRIAFRCRKPEQPSGHHEGGFSMEGVVYLQAETVAGGTIDRLSTRQGDEPADLKIAGGTVTSKGRRHSGRIVVTQKEPRLHARLADGHAIKELTFQLMRIEEHKGMPVEQPASPVRHHDGDGGLSFHRSGH